MANNLKNAHKNLSDGISLVLLVVLPSVRARLVANIIVTVFSFKLHAIWKGTKVSHNSLSGYIKERCKSFYNFVEFNNVNKSMFPLLLGLALGHNPPIQGEGSEPRFLFSNWVFLLTERTGETI